jgi:hypothetical protein
MTSSIRKNCRLLVLVLVFVNAFMPSRASSHYSVGECPKVIVECPTDIPEAGKSYTVKVRVEGDTSNQELSYNWSVSSGEIIEGQGTSSLKIRISDPSKSVTATVEVNGLKLDCDRVASCSFVVN